MQLNLSSYQLKMAYYNYKMFHVSLIITKRKVTVDTKKKKKEGIKAKHQRKSPNYKERKGSTKYPENL